METRVVSIDLGKRGYDIFIGERLLENIDDYFPRDVTNKKVFIITDENVIAYASLVQKGLQETGCKFCEVLVMPSGEGTKSFKHLQDVLEWMLENSIHRNSLVVAIGGGVIGDLTGFAASTVLRGVNFVQIPTTLLSQVDSSVGGKTGINSRYGKNLIGSFYQPMAVIADTNTLKTLPRRELLAGYAEVVKYGLLGDYDFFEWLEEYGDEVVALQDFALIEAIERSCMAKARIVEADEHESGKRALLNLGHTFGHALEAAAGYNGTLLHGEGVSIGMVMAFDLSHRMGLCSRDDYERTRDHLKSVGLPVYASQIQPEISQDVDVLLATMQRDKKVKDGKMTFILVNAIGDSFVTNDVPETLVREVLTASLSAKV